jgi:hypothetical protein
MAYFRNAVVNLLNLHYGIFSIVTTGGGAFYCVYLLKAGVPLPGVLAAMAAILLVRFAIRPALVPLAVRVGLRRLLIVGTLLMALQFPLLALVHGIGGLLLALVIVAAIGDAVYWSCYHAYFAALGDLAHRGHQISMREAIAAVVGIASPIVTGWMLVRFGPMAAFGVAAASTVIAALPLLWTPDVRVAPQVQGAFRAARFGIAMFVMDGWIASGTVFVWQLGLFLSLQQSYLGYGGALAVAALVGAIAGLLLGRWIDIGRGVTAVWLALGSFAVLMLLRAATVEHPALAVMTNALTPIGSCLYMPVLMTAVYNQAKRSPCVLRFHVATEGGWDVGGAAGCLCAAALLYAGAPIGVALLLPIIGIAAAFVALRRYYTPNPIAPDLALAEPAASLTH